MSDCSLLSVRLYARLLMCLLAFALLAPPTYAQTEIGYDDGTAEAQVDLQPPGRGVAVRFTIAPDHELIGARFFIHCQEGLSPVGAAGVCLVLDANGVAGAPGDTLYSSAGWFYSSYSGLESFFSEPISLPDSTAYIAYIRTPAGFSCPIYCGTDTTSVPDGRSWLYEDGVWHQLPLELGDLMIRAVVRIQTPTRSPTWGTLKALFKQGDG